jgi:uncharacterized membrane protein
MSAAEWFEISLIAGGNSLTGFAILFTMISGYMVVAYVAGLSLTTFQVSLANTVYVVGCLFMVFSNYSHVRDAIVARQQAVSMVAEISSGVGFMPATWAAISGAIYCSFVIGSLVFMWQVRHPKSG